MKRLDEMDILEKAAQLEALIAKANLEPGYSIQVKWLENPDYTKREAATLIENARLLFSQNEMGSTRLSQLDYDMREVTHNNYNSSFDSYLKRFPEYEHIEEKEDNIGKRHM